MILSDGTTQYRVTTQFSKPTQYGRRWTLVQVEMSPGRWAQGEAECSPNDAFVKEKGRRIALGRALRDAGFSRVARTTLWADYLHHLHRRAGFGQTQARHKQ